MPSPVDQEIGGRFHDGADHQFIQQVAVMHFDGAGIDAKSFGNHLVGKPSYRQAHNILLPFGQQPQLPSKVSRHHCIEATMVAAFPPP